MYRDKPLRILLVLFGLIFVAGVYPLFTSVRSGWQANKEVAEPMAISLDVTMGIFLLLAAEPKQPHNTRRFRSKSSTKTSKHASANFPSVRCTFGLVDSQLDGSPIRFNAITTVFWGRPRGHIRQGRCCTNRFESLHSRKSKKLWAAAQNQPVRLSCDDVY